MSRTANTGDFDRKDYVPTYNPRTPAPLEEYYSYAESKKNIGKWKRLCGYISIVPIFVLLIIVVITICSTADPRQSYLRFKANKAHRISEINKCSLRLVESIPDGLNYSESDPKFMSTIDAWNNLLDLTKSTLSIGSFYWTMRGIDVVNHTTAAPGEAIFQRLLSNKLNKEWNVRIAQSIPTDPRSGWDTELLSKQGAANVRLVNFPKLLGGGVLHTKLWISENKHFYLGSANMDWRALTQVKELGVLAVNCPQLAQDVLKIFEAYWYLGLNSSTIPSQWPKEYETTINLLNPSTVQFNERYNMTAFFSSSPPPFLAQGRTNDLDAILNTILNAKKFVHIAVMDYFPLMIYTKKPQYWPFIDNALRKAAIENGVAIKLLISWWIHSNPSEDFYLRSLMSLSHLAKSVDIEVKRFIVPTDADQKKIPFGRVNHNKYMVTDNVAYIGTSNWSGDYFTNTAGIGLVLKDETHENTDSEKFTNNTLSVFTLRDELASLFMRDWNSPYAEPLN